MVNHSLNDSLLFALASRPSLHFRVEKQLRLYKEKYHETLRLVAGFMESRGYLEPRALGVGVQQDDAIESAVWVIVRELQKAGIISDTTVPVITLSWYVLRWVIVPFIRTILKQYHGGQ